MVSWKVNGDGNWSVVGSCFHPFDYCGYYDQCSQENRQLGIRIAGENNAVITFIASEPK